MLDRRCPVCHEWEEITVITEFAGLHFCEKAEKWAYRHHGVWSFHESKAEAQTSPPQDAA